MAFPKIIDYFGIKVPVDSWAEIREALQELGPGGIVSESDQTPVISAHVPRHDPIQSGLNHHDRTLLAQFIEAGDRGVLTQQLGSVLGRRGKGVRPALERWSHKINLVTEDNASAFEQIKRFDGRGFKMLEHYRRTAASMIGKPMP